jgi:hypothetical protein
VLPYRSWCSLCAAVTRLWRDARIGRKTSRRSTPLHPSQRWCLAWSNRLSRSHRHLREARAQELQLGALQNVDLQGTISSRPGWEQAASGRAPNAPWRRLKHRRLPRTLRRSRAGKRRGGRRAGYDRHACQGRNVVRMLHSKWSSNGAYWHQLRQTRPHPPRWRRLAVNDRVRSYAAQFLAAASSRATSQTMTGTGHRSAGAQNSNAGSFARNE